MKRKTSPKDYHRKAAIFYNEDRDYDAERWDTPAGKWTKSRQDDIVGSLLADGRSADRVMEVGPGTGRFTVKLVEHLAPSQLDLVDISEEMLARTASRFDKGGSCLVVTYLAPATRLPVDSGCIDFLLALNVFNHVREQEDAICEVRRVLRFGGRALVNFNNLSSWYFPFGLVANRRGRALVADVPAIWRRLTAIESDLHEVGLKTIERVGHTHAPRPLDRRLPSEFFSALDRVSRSRLGSRLGPTQFFLVEAV